MPQERTRTKATTSHFLSRLARILVVIFAGLFAFQMFSAVTGFPQDRLEDWLSCEEMEIDHSPKYVFVIGSTIPGRIGLMNTYYAAEFASNHPCGTDLTFIVAMPVEDEFEQSDALALKQELVLRGIEASQIIFESKGLNTYQQIMATANMLGQEEMTQPFLIITAPLHMRRTFLCCKKQGLTDVMVLPAEEEIGDVDLGPWMFFRYGFWYRLKYQAMIARELVAMGGYKIKGWI